MRIVQNYIGGNWLEAEYYELGIVENPSTGEVIGRVPFSTANEVSRAVESAHTAFADWSSRPVSERVNYLFDLRRLLRQDQEKICRVLVEEMGKSLPDARAELERTIENIEVACGIPVLQQGDKHIRVSRQMDGEVMRLPLGVFALIAPFNFPAMVPFWFLPYAIATGNTYVVKPSELVPNTMQLITGYLDEIGLPPGVFNLVNGDKRASNALIDHPKVVGVSFVGSTPVARLVATRCTEQGKRFQVLGGAKNHLVVMEDANIEEAVRNLITSCYGCAGQRCMAASVIVCVGDKTHDQVVSRFTEASKAALVANPLDPALADQAVVIGPVISNQAKQFIHKMIELGVAEGAELVLDGRDIEVAGSEGGYYVGPTLFTGVTPGMQIHRTEIFGPVVAVMKVNSLDEALTIINEHPYGNGASIYTSSGYAARKFKLEAAAGMIGINVGIPAPVAHLPFGGLKDSNFSQIKAQGRSVIDFFTHEKVITERFWPDGNLSTDLP